MALIKCPECGRDISDKANACVHCGYPLSKAADNAEKKESNSEKTNLSKDDFISILNEIQDSCQTCDLPIIEEKADILSKHQLPIKDNVQEKLDELFAAIENIDFEKIEEVINEIQQYL